MDLIVNSTAAMRSSLGVRRFFTGVMQHLGWPSDVAFTQRPRVRSLERLSELLQLGRRDAILWSPSARGPLYAHHHVVSVHDCINIEYVYRNDWRLSAFRGLFNSILNRAEAIVALSYTTRAAILRNYVVDESKVVVIPAGFDVPHQTSSESSAERRIDGPRFALMVTNSLPHKNTLIACQAFADSLAAKKNVALRVVGSLAPGASLACARAGVDLDVHAHVDDSTLMLWYKSCAFLFSPTLAEGYNLPVAEAIAAGANVLCSDIPVHREFFDEQATFFDATKLDAMVEALNHAYEREGRWHQTLNVPNPRTYRDMAADYRALFNRIAAGT